MGADYRIAPLTGEFALDIVSEVCVVTGPHSDQNLAHDGRQAPQRRGADPGTPQTALWAMSGGEDREGQPTVAARRGNKQAFVDLVGATPSPRASFPTTTWLWTHSRRPPSRRW
jgi:hypothetical protein